MNLVEQEIFTGTCCYAHKVSAAPISPFLRGPQH